MLPQPKNGEALDALDYDREGFQAVAAQAVERCKLGNLDCVRIRAGSLPVYSAGSDYVLKFFPTFDAEAAAAEIAGLKLLAGSLPVPTPELIDNLAIDDWQIVVMRQLKGKPWAEVHDSIPRDQQRRLAQQTGELVHVIRQLDVPTFPGEPWPSFLAARRAEAVTRQKERGLSEDLCCQIEPWLQTTEFVDAPQVYLHTEIMREHLFVQEKSGEYQLSGLIDFEPSRVGAPGYELSSLGLFVGCGDSELWQDLLRGLGTRSADNNAAFQKRCMSWALLHRYSNLAWYMERMPVAEPTLSALAQRWFPRSE